MEFNKKNVLKVINEYIKQLEKWGVEEKTDSVKSYIFSGGIESLTRLIGQLELEDEKDDRKFGFGLSEKIIREIYCKEIADLLLCSPEKNPEIQALKKGIKMFGEVVQKIIKEKGGRKNGKEKTS